MKNVMTNEMMTLEQLDMISGGTNGEYKEIRKLLPTKTIKRNFYHLEGAPMDDDIEYMSPNEVRGWLKSKLGIDAKIDVGGALNPLSSAGSRNVYKMNGKTISHSKVIAEIHNYLGD